MSSVVAKQHKGQKWLLALHSEHSTGARPDKQAVQNGVLQGLACNAGVEFCCWATACRLVDSTHSIHKQARWQIALLVHVLVAVTTCLFQTSRFAACCRTSCMRHWLSSSLLIRCKQRQHSIVRALQLWRTEQAGDS